MSYKFNPLTGTFDIVNPDNFSYNYIKLGCTVCVPLHQQMIVAEYLDAFGDIDLYGDLVII